MSSVTEFLARELKAVLFVTAYFLAWFLVIGLLKSLLLAEYQVSVAATSSAILGSLVIAKVVVVMDATSAGERFTHRAAILHVCYRAVIYTFFVLLVLVLEKIIEGMLDGASFAGAIEEAWHHRNRAHILFSLILIGLSFVVFNTFSVLNRALGDRGVVGALKDPPPPAGGH